MSRKILLAEKFLTKYLDIAMWLRHILTEQRNYNHKCNNFNYGHSGQAHQSNHFFYCNITAETNLL